MEEGTQETEVNEAHPNEGEIEEAVEDVGLDDSPEDVTDGASDSDDQS